uniref:Ig-like domain repeat protein n=1 Tax=Methanobrevibacter sp. TaxID=66852 RepID=UPI0038671DA9
VSNSTVGAIEYINVTVPNDATGYVLLVVGESTYSSNVVGGVARFNVAGLLVGNYTAYATYVGDDNYTSNHTQADFTVSMIKTAISISANSIYVGMDEVLTFEISENITALVHIEIDGVNRTAYLEEGKGTLVINNLTAKTYTVTIYYDGDHIYMASKNYTSFVVNPKKSSAVTVNVTDITVGDVAVIKVNVTKNATGNVTLLIAGDKYSQKVDDEGIAVFNIPDLAARKYHITVEYEGDTYYAESSAEANFTVNKISTGVDANVTDIVVGNTEVITVTVTNATTGRVLINISGTCYYSEVKDGKATFNVDGLKVGKYEAKVIYEGNEKYNESYASKSFTVHPEITLEVGTNDGNTTPITVKVSENATGNVTITVDGKNYTAEVVNGTATVNVTNAKPGKQNMTVTYDDGTGNPTVQNKTVDIPKVTGHTLTAEVTNVNKTDGTATVVVKGPADAEGNVTVTVGNQTFTAPMQNGTAVVELTDIPVGSHDVDVSYGGDDKYEAVSNRTHVNMPINLPTINVIDHLVRGWNSQFDYEAVFTNEFGEVLVNTDVTFIVNGKSYTVKTETHGIARLSETLPVGNYTITSINPVTGEQVTKTLEIVPRLVNNKDLTMDFADGSHWDVLVIGDEGKPVGAGEIIDIYVNTIHYVAVTDANGIAKLKINLNPSSFKISAYYKNYNVSNDLVVKQTLKLVKKTVKAKAGKKFALKAKLKWSNGKAISGKKIVFKFKGKKYTAKTNSKGIAKVVIKKKVAKKLKKGKKYKFTATYISNTVKGKVKVKK